MAARATSSLSIVLAWISVVAALDEQPWCKESQVSTGDAASLIQNRGNHRHRCKVTCNQQADDYFVNLTGLQTCSKPNTLTYAEVVGPEALVKIGRSFNITPVTKAQAKCIMDYKPAKCHDSEQVNCSNTTLQDILYYTSLNINLSVPMYAPPLEPKSERILGSQGMATIDGVPTTLCAAGTPGKMANTFFGNLSYNLLWSACGVEYYDDVGFKDYIENANPQQANHAELFGWACQTLGQGATHEASQCYCMKPGNVGLRCPMFGAVWYANAVFVYSIGGLELLGRMPGCRAAECPEAHACSQTCLHGPVS